MPAATFRPLAHRLAVVAAALLVALGSFGRQPAAAGPALYPGRLPSAVGPASAAARRATAGGGMFATADLLATAPSLTRREPPLHADRALQRRGTAHPAPVATSPAPWSQAEDRPLLGAAVSIVADGTAPWEDRPLTIRGATVLPGRPGAADPGDDLGPNDGVVRSWDTVTYRIAFSVQNAPVEDLTVDVLLDGPATWQRAQVLALGQSRCSGGAQLSADGRQLHCVVGRIEAPPAVTAAFELTARVNGSALQGTSLLVGALVRASGAAADPNPGGCAEPLADGCRASAPPVAVSAAPALELRKYLAAVGDHTLDDVPGRRVTWRLDVIFGADGDVRGTSSPVGKPWVLPDWWRTTGRQGKAVRVPVRLLGCTPTQTGGRWSCVQPDGESGQLAVTLEELELPTRLPAGGAVSKPQVVGSLFVDLWLAEEGLLATGWDVSLDNCFATEPGHPDRPLWAPVDAGGQPNLGGAAEPVANNCASVLLILPERPRPTPRETDDEVDVTATPPRRTPRAPRTPEAQPYKHYEPPGWGRLVAEGAELAAEVGLTVQAEQPLSRVILCDKWDNRTQSLRHGGVAGISAWVEPTSGPPEPIAATDVIIEYAKGPWGRELPSTVPVGRGWYVQSTAACTDNAALSPPGWVTAEAVDFENAGQRSIDARAVNMVRARLVPPVDPGADVWIQVLLNAERLPPGAWLMNYGAVSWGTRSRSWVSPACFGATGGGAYATCPVPQPGASGVPGPLGDMLGRATVPLRLTKVTDPWLADESLLVSGGSTAAFRLEARTFPRPDEAPAIELPPHMLARGVLVTDTLPVGMTYESGSATVASEDLNANGALDAGEDTNHNGIIDYDVPFEPTVRPGPHAGESQLVWRLGDLPYRVAAPAIRFAGRASRLLPSGTVLLNTAAVEEAGAPTPVCGPVATEGRDVPIGAPVRPSPAISGTLLSEKCAWAEVVVANTGAAGVEKDAPADWVMPGQPLRFRLTMANLTFRPVEWFDAVDILPCTGDGRAPGSRLTGDVHRLTVQVLPGDHPLAVWASASEPAILDTMAGGRRDGLVDPVAVWGAGGGLGSAEWPCLLADVGKPRCAAIRSHAHVTALRFWGADPQPLRTGGYLDSFLAVDRPPRFIDLTLEVPKAIAGDVAHNAWGGRFDGLPLPVFDEAVVHVGPRPTSTPPATPTAPATRTPAPSPTVPPSPTASVVPSATAPPSATASPTVQRQILRRVYLPTVLRLPCSGQPVDVVLVIDTSTSMLRPAGDGGSKLDAVLRAARGFLERLAPEATGSRVAIVRLHADASVVEPLTADSARLLAALERLAGDVREGTRLDRGLEVGSQVLGGPLPGRWRALVLLTDGMPNQVPTPAGGGRQEDTVLAIAADLRARGIVIHTVGYGRPDAPDPADRISPELLRGIAGGQENYHQTDQGAELAALFLRIAAGLRCAGEDRWP